MGEEETVMCLLLVSSVVALPLSIPLSSFRHGLKKLTVGLVACPVPVGPSLMAALGRVDIDALRSGVHPLLTRLCTCTVPCVSPPSPCHVLPCHVSW